MAAILLLKASLLLAATFVAARLLRRAPAVSRHRLWSVAFAAVLALPLLAWVLPAVNVPVPAGWGAETELAGADPRVHPGADPSTLALSVPTGELAAGTRSDSDVDKLRPIADVVLARSASRVTRANAAATLVALWLIGTTAASAALLVSLLHVRRLAHSGEELADPSWRLAADALGARLGVHRSPRLLVSAAVGTPMAGGIWRSVIFLPASAREWSAERRDVVLAHEIAHLAGRDPLRHVLARLALALYWFHPLAWMAARQAAVAREQACDETVLALGTRPSAYARVLLDFAESMHRSATVLAALPMVDRSLLEARLMAILTDDARPVIKGRMLVPAIGVVLLTITVAAAQPRLRSHEVPASFGAQARFGSPEIAASFGAPGARSSEFVPPTSRLSTVDSRQPTLDSRRSPPLVRGADDLRPGTDSISLENATVSATQANADRDSACWWNVLDGRSFSGNISTNTAGGRSIINEQVGTRGADRVIQKRFGDMQLCMLAEDAGDRRDAERPSQWLGRARRVVMEARRGSAVQTLEIVPQGGGTRTTWRVAGTERPFDATAQRWRDRMLAALDTTWELAMLRGEASSLRGQISSIRGQQSSIRGEISSFRGEVSSMRGRISSLYGEVSSLRGQISSIQGHVSSLHGAISSEQGAISSLNGSRYRATDAELRQISTIIARHQDAIARVEQEIRDYNAAAKIAAVERDIQALDAGGKVAAIEAEIRAFDLDGKVAAAERRIAALDVEGRVAAIERQIQALDVDRRSRQLEERRDSELKQLEAAIAAVR